MGGLREVGGGLSCLFPRNVPNGPGRNGVPECSELCAPAAGRVTHNKTRSQLNVGFTTSQQHLHTLTLGAEVNLCATATQNKSLGGGQHL